MAKYILQLPKEVQKDIFDKSVKCIDECCGADYIMEEYGISVVAFVCSEVMCQKLADVLNNDEDSIEYGLTYENFKQYL